MEEQVDRFGAIDTKIMETHDLIEKLLMQHSGEINTVKLPEKFELASAYPNPFNSFTYIVNRIIIKAGEHCQATLSNLLQSLHLEQCQLDELWSFVQKKELLHQQTNSNDMGEHGSG